MAVDLGTLQNDEVSNRTLDIKTSDGKVSFHMIAVPRVTPDPKTCRITMLNPAINGVPYDDIIVDAPMVSVGGGKYSIDFDMQFPSLPYGAYTITGVILFDAWSANQFHAVVTLVNSTITYEIITTEYSLTISTTVGGTTNPPPSTYTYVEGTVVQITAYPIAGWDFSHWVLDGTNVGSANPIMITMDTNHTLVANFSEIKPRGCFIATAAYGTSLAPEINVLRKFRDKCLPNKIIDCYYTLSPWVANYIWHHSKIRYAIRKYISLLVSVLKKHG